MEIQDLSREVEVECEVRGGPAYRINSWPIWTAAAIYVVLVALLHPFYRYHINPDATAYDSLAQKWASGDWTPAITGHWAPLLTWLLAIAHKLGLGLFAAITIIDAVASITLLAALDRVCKELSLSDGRRFVALSLASVWVVAFTFDDITPDTLLCASLTWYLAICLKGDFLWSTRQACWLGLVAGIAYLIKPYAIYFIALHLAIVVAARLRRHPVRRVIWMRSCATLAGVALCFVALWVGAMSFRYHRFTTGSIGSMSLRLMSPRWPSNYVNNIGLVEPPNKTAVSYWEDPEVDKLGLPSWSPLESVNSFRYYLRWVGGNAARLLLWFAVASLAAIPLLFLVVREWKRVGYPLAIGLLVLAIILYPAGYILLVVANRYFWPTAIWLIVLAAYIVPLRKSSLIALLLVWISFLPYPLWCLSADLRQGTAEHAIGTAARRHGLNGTAASINEWHRSLYVSYYAGLQYCGTTAATSGPQVGQELKKLEIKYLIIWPGATVDRNLIDHIHEIADPDFRPARIYALADR